MRMRTVMNEMRVLEREQKTRVLQQQQAQLKIQHMAVELQVRIAVVDFGSQVMKCAYEMFLFMSVKYLYIYLYLFVWKSLKRMTSNWCEFYFFFSLSFLRQLEIQSDNQV